MNLPLTLMVTFRNPSKDERILDEEILHTLRDYQESGVLGYIILEATLILESVREENITHFIQDINAAIYY